MKIAVLGAGHLGKIHIRCLKEIPEYQLAGFYDPDPAISEKVEKEFGIKRFESIDAAVEAADVIDIVTRPFPTFSVLLPP
jgi:predicted dehydrogenase